MSVGRPTGPDVVAATPVPDVPGGGTDIPRNGPRSRRRTAHPPVPPVRNAVGTAVAVACVAAVGAGGEFSTAALIAVLTTGGLLGFRGLSRRAGRAAPRVGRRALPWLFWLGALLAWESTALAHEALPTVSDLLDPVLREPLPRATATVGWLAAGVWLVTRPSDREGAR